MNLRPYQQAAVDAVYEHLRSKNTNPCIVMPTGTGKSVVIAKIVSDAVTQWNGRVLILAHVKELLEQNAGKIHALCPKIPLGIYSAGLKSRDTDDPVIVAGIQSVYNKACDLGAFDLIIVDEAHLIAPDGDGMYRSFLKDMAVINPHVRIIGLTATPFRVKGGLICKEENILQEVCYEAGLKEMILHGYLSPIISRAGKTEANLENLHIRGGEFIADEIAEAMDKEELVDTECREIVELTRDRKSVLIFTTSLDHCQHVAEKIAAISGQECAIITGDTPAQERADIIARFRGEHVPADLLGTPMPPLKYLCNVSVLTTGFDAPGTDCVVMLRPTNSPGLLLQIAGRGLRLSPETGKKDCLFLDYGGNILRHGPLDMIRIKEKTAGNGGDAPAKKCPQCLALIHAALARCPECGHTFPTERKNNLSSHASTQGVLSGQIISTDYTVHKTYYEIHHKRNADEHTPRTMRVDYEVGFGQYKSEWVCPEHVGYARRKFEKWWQERTPDGCPMPATVEDAVGLARAGFLTPVTGITVRSVTGEKFDRISAYEFGAPADEIPPDDWRELYVEYRPPANRDDYEDPPF